MTNLCSAIKGLNNKNRHIIFEQFSKDEYNQLSTLEVLDEHAKKLADKESIEGFELIYKIVDQTVDKMAECLEVQSSQLKVEYKIIQKNAFHDNFYSRINWHQDGNRDITGTRVILNLIGEPTLFVPYDIDLYKQTKEILNQDYGPIKSWDTLHPQLNIKAESARPGEAVAFKMGGDGSIHSAPKVASNEQRLVVLINYLSEITNSNNEHYQAMDLDINANENLKTTELLARVDEVSFSPEQLGCLPLLHIQE